MHFILFKDSFGELLGKGSFGEVYKGEKGGRYYAVKKINETKMAAEIEQLFADSVSARFSLPFFVSNLFIFIYSQIEFSFLGKIF
jgi:serine/threonine protein kinase